MRLPRLSHSLAGVQITLALAVLGGSGPALAREGYFEQYCAVSGCHAGTARSGSPADSPSCAACHYHGMREVNKRWKKVQAFRGWTDRTLYQAGQLMRIFVTGGDQPGWVRVRVRDQNGREVARATGPTGMGDDMQPHWTASVLPGPIVLKVPAPALPGRYRWTVGWYGNIAKPNPPAILEGQAVISHRTFRLGWHDVELPPFDVTSTDSEGPSVSGQVVSPSATGGAIQIRVGALASDADHGGTPIGEARARIVGGSAGSGTDWSPLRAVDGTFDASEEQITGVLEMDGLAPGPYTAVVQAADAMGNWGQQSQSGFVVTPPPPGDVSPPVASCMTPKPSLLPPGQPVMLRALLEDLGSGGSPIHEAEAFVSAPGQDGSGLILTPADGVLDSASEKMQGILDTHGLADGEYPVLIHGNDAAGLWSEYCLASFEVSRAADTTAPSVTSARAIPVPTMGTAVATIHAGASDDGSGFGDIVAAEIVLDPNEPPGAGLPMQAADGAFDSQEEPVTGSIAVAGWEPGAYMVGIRARDAAGWWSDPVWVSLQVSHAGEDRAGPRVLDLGMNPRVTNGATETVLSGRVDDSRTGRSRPALVEIHLDIAGPPGTGIPIIPRAGRSPRSSLYPRATARFAEAINVVGFGMDEVVAVYVRAMDEHGNWGPLAATAFRITPAP